MNQRDSSIEDGTDATTMPSVREPMTYYARVAGVAVPPGYSHAVAAARPVLVAVAGQVSLDADGAIVGAGDFGAQVERALANLVSVLAAAGCTPADVLKLTHFVVGLDGLRLAAVRAARDRVFRNERPASSLIGVASLASPAALYEVEALAARDA
jgi:enamine deaminase RidA (YjgF/YER057c/UK114 family)